MLRIGVVGAYELRPKGVKEALEGLRLARDLGLSFELWRALFERLYSSRNMPWA